jgi:hypothetical protein
MKRFAMVLLSGMLAAASLRCAAESACRQVTVEASVEAGQGELTLADLLGSGACPQLREAAAQVSLGAVPRAGSVRVLDGRQIRGLLEGIAGEGSSWRKTVSMQVPERIVVRRSQATKSCAEIARFVASAAPSEDRASAPSRWQEDLDCAGARGIPQDTPLELTRTAWNAALSRWEFALRCTRPEDCVPFLVWVHGRKTSRSGTTGRLAASAESTETFRTGENRAERLVERGQTATLIWDQAGIRVVLPVTCLDAGALGQFVRVRFKNVARILRAEVVGAGTLRASL